jgi:hypothetical protein
MRTFSLVVATPVATLQPQNSPAADPIIRRIFDAGMDSSQVYPLAQALHDSDGPRRPGRPA